MDQSKPTVFTDDRVASAVLDVIRNAERYVVLVSPYNQFWDHLRDDLRLAVRRNVQVTLIYREDQPATDIDWVGSLGVTVYGVGRLHAKIFMNESVLLVTSMNLLETSSKNSKEIAIQINDEVT
ncbi:MAG: hypothetical protein FJ317_09010, partial [SAR202 cluster bacterium]|nr:hypothetical protein [SAR202 cluster bacterium]